MRTFREHAEDHEHWRSMPHAFLHAQTHGVLRSHNIVPERGEKPGHFAHYNQRWGSYSHDVDHDKLRSDLENLGWRHSDFSGTTVYTHPNGSHLLGHPWQKERFTLAMGGPLNVDRTAR